MTANKFSKKPESHPAGKRIMNKQPYLTGNCHLQVAITSEMVRIDYREEAAYVSRKLKNQVVSQFEFGSERIPRNLLRGKRANTEL
jgi:hypothetical protein